MSDTQQPTPAQAPDALPDTSYTYQDPDFTPPPDAEHIGKPTDTELANLRKQYGPDALEHYQVYDAATQKVYHLVLKPITRKGLNRYLKEYARNEDYLWSAQVAINDRYVAGSRQFLAETSQSIQAENLRVVVAPIRDNPADPEYQLNLRLLMSVRAQATEQLLEIYPKKLGKL